MPERYLKLTDIPPSLPVFPLRGAILLPRASIPLNIFEPRYLAMIDDVLAGSRLIGVIQPADLSDESSDNQSPEGKNFELKSVGCVGRLTSFSENDDGTVLITLTGIARFSIVHEDLSEKPYRIFNISMASFTDDLVQGYGDETVDRKTLLKVLKNYLEAHGLSADWNSIREASTEHLVNTLSVISPYGPEEKQALLEAPDLKTRSEILVALAEMELAGGESGSSSALQ